MVGNRTALALACIIAMPLALVQADSIEKDQIDASQIYYGSPTSFENPAEVDVEAVIAATPEYQKIQKRKIDKGTGKYWILRGQASNRALKAISDVAEETDYDLIAEMGYLGNLEPPVACDDITELVISKV